MKTIHYGVFAVAAAALALAPTRAYAFHSGGVAECEGCHTMHNTKQSGRGNPFYQGDNNNSKYLLQGGDQSSTCLNCHNSADSVPSGYHISTDDSMLAPGKPPVEMTPGGDFAWLKKTYNTTVRGSVTVNGNDGNTHGHNIIARDYGYVVDPDNTTAPGGTYPAASLSCVSCHDPHGTYRRLSDGSIIRGAGAGLAGATNPDTIGGSNGGVNKVPPIYGSGSYSTSIAPTANVSAVGVYRILGGVQYQPKSVAGSFAFVNPQPVAVAPSTYNRSEGVSQTHVAYGSGMSEWCANCHTGMLNSNGANSPGHPHPAGNAAHLTQAIVNNYNAYVTSGDMSNADMTQAFSTLAPIELGLTSTNANYTTLQGLAVNTDTKDQSATTSSNVMCLSCHRAHATAFAEATRFLTENEFMTVGDTSGATIAPAYDGSATENKINQGYSVAEQQAAYYGRPASFFGPNARNYCNKCHAKD